MISGTSRFQRCRILILDYHVTGVPLGGKTNAKPKFNLKSMCLLLLQHSSIDLLQKIIKSAITVVYIIVFSRYTIIHTYILLYIKQYMYDIISDIISLYTVLDYTIYA